MTELLDLSTIVKHDTVRITSRLHPDGKLYELANVDDFDLEQLEKIELLDATRLRLQGLKRKLKPAESRELKKALADSVKLILPGIEPVVLKALSDMKLLQILITWHTRLPKGQAGGQGNAKSRTGAGSSRVSKPSTAATRKRGSAHRSGS